MRDTSLEVAQWLGGAKVGECVGTLTYSFPEPSSSVPPHSQGLGTEFPPQVAGRTEHPRVSTWMLLGSHTDPFLHTCVLSPGPSNNVVSRVSSGSSSPVVRAGSSIQFWEPEVKCQRSWAVAVSPQQPVAPNLPSLPVSFMDCPTCFCGAPCSPHMVQPGHRLPQFPH